MTSALVLGGGLAGMLAASVLARHVDKVTIVENDELPGEPQPRKGLPQAHHSHVLMSGGARSLDSLLPGTTDRLYEAGAHHRGLPEGTLTLSANGWLRRHDNDAFTILCSRDLLDHVVRQQVLRDEKIEVVESTKVLGLAGDAKQVTGAKVERANSDPETLSADFVVDATGRRSKAPQWLEELGLPAVDEETIDPGQAYATRLYEAPAGVDENFPSVAIQPQSGTDRPGYGATVYPIEGGRWMVTMTGTRGGEPPTDEDGFLSFARNQRHPIVAELLASATPIGEIRPYRGTINRRRYFEKLPMPEGFVAMGDAVAALNPVYGHGMSVAAHSAVALRDELDRTGLKPGVSATLQAGIAKASEGAWMTASSQDLGFPGVKSNRERKGVQFTLRMNARIMRTAISHPPLASTMFKVHALSVPMSEMSKPSVLLAALRGPRRPPLTAEQAFAQFPELGDLRRRPSATTSVSDAPDSA